MVYRIQIEVDGIERWVNKVDYEYFKPMPIDEDLYEKFLYKNFPYEIGDDYDLFPYRDSELPKVIKTPKDKELSQEAHWKATCTDPFFYVPDGLTKKQIYYRELTEMRYRAKLDHGIIPNLYGLYDRLVKPLETKSYRFNSNLEGGIFNIELDSSSNDDFWYEWMFNDQMRNGVIRFFDDIGNQEFKIEFWDCFVISIGEQMSSMGYAPMTMKLRLSPASTRNRNIEHQKVWKQSEIRQPWKPLCISPPPTEKKKQLLVEKLEGPFFEDGKKAEELIMGTTYIYKVSKYNDGAGNKLESTHWSVELNNDGKLKELPKSKTYEEKGKICYKYTPEEAESIRIYAWCNKASKDVSVDVPVVVFPFCVDRVNLPGLDRNLKDIAEDMTFGYGKVDSQTIYSPSMINQFKSEYIKNGFDYNGKHSVFANKPNKQYPIKAIYSEQQMADTEVALFGKEWMKWYDSGDDIMKYKSKEEYPDEKLFDIFRDKAKYYFTKGKLTGNIERMIDKFQANEGGVYEDKYLSEALIHSSNMELYCNNVQDYIAQRLKERKGLILREIDGANPLLDETVYLVLNEKSQKARLAIGKTTTILRGDGSGNCFFFRPTFGSSEDRTKGTQIATNDIWSTEVKITNISFNGDDYTVDYHVNLWDHFGLDIGDMEAMPNIIPFAKETFAVWFVLQHLRGYKPFITKVEFNKSFTGNLTKGMKARVLERKGK